MDHLSKDFFIKFRVKTHNKVIPNSPGWSTQVTARTNHVFQNFHFIVCSRFPLLLLFTFTRSNATCRPKNFPGCIPVYLIFVGNNSSFYSDIFCVKNLLRSFAGCSTIPEISPINLSVHFFLSDVELFKIGKV